MPFFERGHDVERYELPRDITKETFEPGQFDFIWASPPCTEYSKLFKPFASLGPYREVDLGLWEHCLRLIAEAKPRYYIIENVQGALRIWGQPKVRCGSFYLWGDMPAWPVGVFRKNTQSWPKASRARERGRIPRPLAEQVCDIIEDAFGY